MLLKQEAPPRPKTIVQQYRERVKERTPLTFDTILGRGVQQHASLSPRGPVTYSHDRTLVTNNVADYETENRKTDAVRTNGPKIEMIKTPNRLNQTVNLGEVEKIMRIKKAFSPQQRYQEGKKSYNIEQYEKNKNTAFKDKAAATIFGKEGSPQRSYSPFKK